MSVKYMALIRLRYGLDMEEVGFNVQSVRFKVGEFTSLRVHEFTGSGVKE